MSHSCEWQASFALAIRDRELPVPPGILDPMRRSSAKRFAVYRNNVVLGLVEALRDTFPVACRIVGVEFFNAMARVYVSENPPRSPVLLKYGSNFAQFIDRFDPVAGLPYLADVSRIERAWLEAYHSAEAASLDIYDGMSRLMQFSFSEVSLHLHPSVQLVSSRYPALTIWCTNLEGVDAVPVNLDAGGENVLIVRPGSVVDVLSVSNGEMAFVKALAGGSTIFEASESAKRADSSFALMVSLEGLVDRGVITDFRVHSTADRDLRLGQRYDD